MSVSFQSHVTSHASVSAISKQVTIRGVRNEVVGGNLTRTGPISLFNSLIPVIKTSIANPFADEKVASFLDL